MKRPVWKYRALLLAVLVGACGGGGGGGSPSGAAPAVPRFAYVANFNDNTVSLYTVDAATGQLRHNGYAATGTNPFSVAVDPAGRFAYVANFSSNDVSAFAIDPATGALTPIDANPFTGGLQNFAAGSAPLSVTVDPSGRFAYVANEGSNDVSAFTIDAVTGALTAIDADPGTGGVQNFAAGTFPVHVAIAPSGRFAYAANVSSNDVSAYVISSTTGALAPVDADPNTAGVQNFTTGSASAPVWVAVDPSGRFAYVANRDKNEVAAFAINASSGALTPILSFPTSGLSAQSVAVDPSGRFAYVANKDSGDISAFTINATTGGLTPVDADAGTAGIQNFPAGTAPVSVGVDPSGKFAYAANQSSSDVSVFAIDPASGALSAAGTVRARPGATSLAIARGMAPVAYTPRFAYVANSGDNDLSAFTVDPASGALTPAAAPTFATGTKPMSVAVHSSGKFAYVANAVDGSISGFRIDAAGALTGIDANGGVAGIQNFAAGSSPRSIAIDPSGRFAYAANTGSANVSAYSIDAATGLLTAIAGSPFTSGSLPVSVAADPTGRFVYVANSADNTVSAYSINSTTGALTAIDANPSLAGVQNFATGTTPSFVAVEPSGRFVYVTNKGAIGPEMSAFAIDAGTGALTPVFGSPFEVGGAPVGIAVHPSAKFAYVVSAGINGVGIDQTSGALAALPHSPFPTGAGPSFVTVDASGRFVYALVAAGVSLYPVDATTGVLTLPTSLPLATGAGPAAMAILSAIH